MKVSELIQELQKFPQDLDVHKQLIETKHQHPLTGTVHTTIVVKIQILMRPTKLIIN